MKFLTDIISMIGDFSDKAYEEGWLLYLAVFIILLFIYLWVWG